MDRVHKQILIYWLVGQGIMLAVWQLYPTERITFWMLAARSVMFLSAIYAFFVYKVDVNRISKVIFGILLCFLLWGSIGLFLVEVIANAVFEASEFSSFYISFYASLTYLGLGLLSGTFLVFAHSVVSQALRTRMVANAAIVVVVIIIVFNGYACNPRLAYRTPDITDFRIIDRACQELRKSNKTASVENIADLVGLSKWEGFQRVGELSEAEEIARIIEILPFVSGRNYENLVQRPFRIRGAIISALSALSVGLYLLLQLVSIQPQPLYIERLFSILFLYHVFDAFHEFTFAFEDEFQRLVLFDAIGKGISSVILVGVVVFTALRLHFLHQPIGRYYEQRICLRPHSVTRWRDGIDDLIIKSFFYRSSRRGRFVEVLEKSVWVRRSRSRKGNWVLRKISGFFRKNS